MSEPLGTPIMKIRKGVSVKELAPQTVLAMLVARDVYARHGVPCEVTSCFRAGDPRLHGKGRAFDIRLPSRFGASTVTDSTVASELVLNLPDEYDIVLELVPQHQPPHSGWGPHIHVEYDPK